MSRSSIRLGDDVQPRPLTWGERAICAVVFVVVAYASASFTSWLGEALAGM